MESWVLKGKTEKEKRKNEEESGSQIVSQLYPPIQIEATLKFHRFLWKERLENEEELFYAPFRFGKLIPCNLFPSPLLPNPNQKKVLSSQIGPQTTTISEHMDEQLQCFLRETEKL